MYVAEGIDRWSANLDFATDDVWYKWFDGGSAQVIALWLVLGHVVTQADESDRWYFLFRQTEELQDTLVFFIVGIQVDKQHLIALNQCQL